MFHMPSATTVYGAKQMSIETKKEMHNDLVDERRNFWMQTLLDKRKHIDNARSMLYHKIPLGGKYSLVINKELLIIPSLVFGPCKYHLCGPYNTRLIRNRHLVHLMRILTTCSIHNRETFMWDRG